MADEPLTDSDDDERVMMERLGEWLARSAAENDCSVTEFVDHMFAYLGVPATAAEHTDFINRALRADFEAFRSGR